MSSAVGMEGECLRHCAVVLGAGCAPLRDVNVGDVRAVARCCGFQTGSSRQGTSGGKA